ncbi:MAG: hypothetical protein ABFC95_07495 [Smithella sp.]|jgi:hypothetical protein
MNNNPSTNSGSNLDNAVIPLMPIWDTINDLNRLRGIVAAAAYLTGPTKLKEGDDFEVFHEVFNDINERLGAACDVLEEARQSVKFMKEEEKRA